LKPNNYKPLTRVHWSIAITCLILAFGIFSTPIIVRSIPQAWMLNGQIVLASPASGACNDHLCSHVPYRERCESPASCPRAPPER
jgi:hypothetical protein